MKSNNSIEDYGNIRVLSHVYEVFLSPTATMERDTRIEKKLRPLETPVMDRLAAVQGKGPTTLPIPIAKDL